MIEITFKTKKDSICVGTSTIKTTEYDRILKFCNEFNEDLSKDTYVCKISNLSSSPTYTMGLNFKPKFLKPVKITGKKHSVLGSDPFNCDYLIPLENENG
tara:strand:+ start:175 stop:474 length:300 start_codon:yes stop_codon:yes gene_type:complete